MQSKQYQDTRTGEIVTQVPIMEMKFFKEVQVTKEVKAVDFMRGLGITVTEIK